MFEGILINAGVSWAILGLAALGGLLSERSGIINIALEGKMLTAASVSAAVGIQTGSAIFGLLAGVLAAIVLSLTHYTLTQAYKLDHIVSGMALNFFALGATNFLGSRIPASSGVAVFPGSAFTAALLIGALLIALVMVRSRFGLRLLATGNDPEKAREVGILTHQVRLQAMIFTGVFCGLSGVAVMSNIAGFSDRMTAGQGYIALAALIVSEWKPVRVVVVTLVFALFQAVQIQMQGKPVFGVELPSEFWSSLPYLVTLLALGGLLGKVRPPRGLGQP